MVKEAIAINEESRCTNWKNAIEKEMKNVKVAFEILPDGKKAPDEFQFANCHVAFKGERLAKLWHVTLIRHLIILHTPV